MTTILNGIITFVSTGMDYLMVLLVLFHRFKHPRQRLAIICADYAGTSILVIIALVAALVLRQAPDQWLLGFLGLVPLMLGGHLLIHGQTEPSAAQRVSGHHLFLTVTTITVTACGADNLGVYIPYFTILDRRELILTLVTFAVMVAIFCLLAYTITHLPVIKASLDHFGPLLTGILYLWLGTFILIDNGTILHLWRMLGH